MNKYGMVNVELASHLLPCPVVLVVVSCVYECFSCVRYISISPSQFLPYLRPTHSAICGEVKGCARQTSFLPTSSYISSSEFLLFLDGHEYMRLRKTTYLGFLLPLVAETSSVASGLRLF